MSRPRPWPKLRYCGYIIGIIRQFNPQWCGSAAAMLVILRCVGRYWWPVGYGVIVAVLGDIPPGHAPLAQVTKFARYAPALPVHPELVCCPALGASAIGHGTVQNRVTHKPSCLAHVHLPFWLDRPILSGKTLCTAVFSAFFCDFTHPFALLVADFLVRRSHPERE